MNTPYKVGDWTVYPDSNRLVHGDTEQVVEPRVVGLLNCFAARPGEVLNRDFLIECAWDGVIVSESTINHTIGVLRRTLGDKARSPRYIETVAKKGYRLLVVPEPVVVSERAEPPSSGHAASYTGRPFLIGMTAAVLLLIVGAYIFLPSANTEPVLPTFSQLRPITSEAGRELDPVIDPAGKYVYFSHVPEGGGQADLYRQLIGGGSMEPVLEPTSDASEFSPVISPDGGYIAYARRQGQECRVHIAALDLSSDEELLESCGRYGAQLSWSPAGEVYFISAAMEKGPQKVYKISPKDGQVSEVTDARSGIGDYTYALSQDGSQVAYMRTTHWNHGDLRVKNLKTGEDKLIYQFPTWFNDLAFDETGEYVYFTADFDRHTLERIHIETGRRETVYRQDKSLGEFNWLPSGGMVATQSSWDMNIYSTALPEGQTASLGSAGEKLVFSTRADWQPRLSPDGRTLAFLSDRTGQLEIWASNREGRNARQISHLGGDKRIHVYDWSPDGRSFVFDATGDSVHVLDVATGDTRAVTPQGMMARNPAFGPDGSFVVFTSDKSGTWQIWRQDLAGGEPVQLTTGGGFSARYGTDGTLFFTKYHRDGLWQLDAESGADKLAVPKMISGPIQQWELTPEGVYYMNMEQFPTRLMYLPWTGGAPKALFQIPFVGFTFEMDRLTGQILFSREDDRTSDIVLVH